MSGASVARTGVLRRAAPWLRAMALVLLFLPIGCAKQAYPSGAAMMDADAPSPKVGYGMAREMAPSAEMDERMAPEAPSSRPVSQGNTVEAPAPARMVHYNGWAQLRVADPQASVDALTAYVRGLEGYVESLSGTVLTVRVPVARFDEAFTHVLGAGELVRKSISAEDVTDAFTAVELRTKSLKAQRERLVELLGRAKEEEEKLSLLRQIQAVTEQLDQLEAQARVLSRLASFARITVQLEARPSLSWSGAPDGAAFTWIRGLSPFSDTLDGRRVLLPVPEGLVALDGKQRFAAESADGVRLWTDRLANDPEGDAAWWTRAIQDRLAGDFAATEVDTQGAWTRIRFTSRSAPAYTWWVLVRVDGRHLDVAQVYFPSEAHVTRLGAAVLAAFGGAA